MAAGVRMQQIGDDKACKFTVHTPRLLVSQAYGPFVGSPKIRICMPFLA